jgi:hypothetical protein
MFGLLLEEMPGSDAVPWSQKPEDMEKQLIWKEQMAGQILFGKAFQACNKHHRSAFVSRFFGLSVALSEAKSVSSSISSSVTSSIKADSKELVTANTTAIPSFMNHQIVKPSEEKKPVQATLSSFMKYEFVVKTIQKIERKKRAEVKKEAKAKEQKAVEKPKNEIIVDQ